MLNPKKAMLEIFIETTPNRVSDVILRYPRFAKAEFFQVWSRLCRPSTLRSGQVWRGAICPFHLLEVSFGLQMPIGFSSGLAQLC